MQLADLKKLRARAWASLSPQTAEVAGISLGTLQQFLTGGASLSEQQLNALATWLGIIQRERR